MARKHKHEDHVNHEAWAIPYGDLITLLLAFFVVMYAISSVNEGKYRAASESLNAAFNGSPKTNVPVQIGSVTVQSEGMSPNLDMVATDQPVGGEDGIDRNEDMEGSLGEIAEAMRQQLSDLIEARVILLNESTHALEIVIQTDLLFPSGTAVLSQQARDILTRLSDILERFPNPIRVEGHTDNVPISTPAYPSNWELSAARAASVVHLLMRAGVDPARMAVIGFGEYRPVADNALEAGRNRNRRVQLIVSASQLTAPAVRESVAPGIAPIPQAVVPSAAGRP